MEREPEGTSLVVAVGEDVYGGPWGEGARAMSRRLLQRDEAVIKLNGGQGAPRFEPVANGVPLQAGENPNKIE